MEKIIVDAMGMQCPIPVVKTKKAIQTLREPTTIETHVDNQIAVENLKKLATGLKAAVSVEKKEEEHFVVTIEVISITDESSGCNSMSETVYVFGSNTMGSGDDELGTTLMKGFIYAVSQLPNPPKTCIFYNSGAKLTAEGSDSIEDLKALEEKGVEILTCGTCANFFGVGNKINVGSITNMYTIVEKLDNASKIIKP